MKDIKRHDLINESNKAPIRILTIVLLLVFSAELVLMLLIDYFEWSTSNAILLDSFLLIIVLFPALYAFVYSPLKTEIRLNEELIKKLKNALDEVQALRGIIPICSKCKKIRDDKGYWHQVDHYISEHSEVEFSHGMCRKCSDELYGGQGWYEEAVKDGEIPSD